jgi:hypothetical protein
MRIELRNRSSSSRRRASTPVTLEMLSCGFPNARWDPRIRTVTLCYELAVEFTDLYRGFGNP